MSSLSPRVKGITLIVLLFVVGIAATALLEAYGTDLHLAGMLFRQGGDHGGWVFGRDVPWGFLYDYGEIPGILVAVACLALMVAALRGKARRDYVRPCLVVILTVIIGPGIIVNGVLKGCWGRPRPADVTLFEGAQEYRRVAEPGGPGSGKSFTCGHCSMAYSVASLSAFYPYHPVLAVAALLGGIAFGTLTGVARMTQGGHFLTDVLWSGIIVFMVFAALYYLVLRVPEQAGERRPRDP